MVESNEILSDKDFYCLRDIIVKNFGIVLNKNKKTLIISRLREYLSKREFCNFGEYIEVLNEDNSGSEISELINRISTNHTFFFREKEHYRFFINKALAEFKEKLEVEKDFRMWCAGCSYGDEPYSFQILLFEYFGIEYLKWKAGILATDISESVLKSAEEGIFNEYRIRHVPEKLLEKYFIKDGDYWHICGKVKDEVIFRRFNLMNEYFPYKKNFHIISCRNVMIYFNDETRNKLLSKFYDFLEKGGYLFIGQSEFIDKSNSDFRFVVPGIYKKA